MTELESSLEKYFYRQVRLAGGRAYKVIPVLAGVPDRLVLFPGGRIYLVELKKDDGTVSAIQKHWHAEAERLGTHVHVVYGRRGVQDWLRAVVDSMSVPNGQRARLRQR